MTTTANEYDQGPKLNHIEWAKWKRELIGTGTYNPERWHELDQYQKDWTADTLSTMKWFKEQADPDHA